MARHKEFDKTQVLNKAAELFWRQGYEATSIQNLVDHVGIGRGSLYDTFGDKRGLFLAALAHYTNELSGQSFTPLLQGTSPKTAIVQVFQNLVEDALADKPCSGCFIINSAMELVPHDPAVVERAKSSIIEMEALFHRTLLQAVEVGELTTERDWHPVARFLTNAVLGLRVLSKMNPDRQFLEESVAVTLSVLD